jgi:hypothetical protein
MTDYKSIYKWMIIPMAVMQLGIFMDYWGDFSQNAWSVHVHYWTGTAWYLFLIIQPYYATHGQLERHRTLGIVGMFIAGGVCLTALSMLYRDMASANDALADPQRFSPFQPWFFYGIASVEFVMMVAFGFAVVKSILHRKEIENHSWWLVSTVFTIMMPALARGLGFVWFAINSQHMPNVGLTFMFPLYVTQALIIGMILVGAWKFGTLRHPATYLSLGVNLFVLFLEPIGRSTTVEAFLKAVIKN